MRVIPYGLVLIVLAAPPRYSASQQTVAEVVKRSSDAVVLIVISDSNGQETALGSGFLISADGEIVTNFHVIKGATSASVKLSSGAFFPVSGILASDPDGDLAVIKVKGNNLPFLLLKDNNKLSVGDHVIAIGSPLGLEGTVSDGIVSAIRPGDQDKHWIQTTAPVSPGNSGGPLLEMSGGVVGVITWKVSSQEGENLNFAVPSDEVKSLLSKLDKLVPLESIDKDGKISGADSDHAEQTAVKQDPIETQAVEQLRVIAKAIGECPDRESTFNDHWDYDNVTHYATPINVVWDIERKQSYRSDEVGYVEFVQHVDELPVTMKDCKKKDYQCNDRNEAERMTEYQVAASGANLPLQYKYEFDFGNHGLEFSRAIWKHEKDDSSHWAAMKLEDNCESRAIWTNIKK